MKEFVWIFPILAAVSVVLGGCRADELAAILRESGKTFLRIVAAILGIVIILQIILWLVPKLA